MFNDWTVFVRQILFAIVCGFNVQMYNIYLFADICVAMNLKNYVSV
jgi:hypothetical protein